MQSTCRFLHHFIGTSSAIRGARLGEFVFKRLPALEGISLKNYTKAWRGEGVCVCGGGGLGVWGFDHF